VTSDHDREQGHDQGDPPGEAPPMVELGPPEPVDGVATRRRGPIVAAVAVAVLVLGGLGALVWSKADDRLGGSTAAGPPGQVGVPWERGLLSLDGTTLAVRFEGVAGSGDEVCGAHYTGLSAALPGALRVTVITIPGPGPADGSTCPGERAVRCTEVRLPYPPGNQPVVDAMTGEAPPLEQVPTSLGPATAGSGTDATGGTGADTGTDAGHDSTPGDLCAELTAS
jgi:hypothetical protein